MCYFVEMNLPRQKLADRFGVSMPEDPRYMPANFLSAFTLPFLPVISVRQKDQIQMFRWGLIPSWVKDESSARKILAGTFNARSESAWEKPSFRNGVRYNRCLVLAHGFFEYQDQGKEKIPYYIRLKEEDAFAFAGISESWTNKETGEIIQTFSILTRKADEFMERIHNTKKRMPVILQKEVEKEWINDSLQQSELQEFIQMPSPSLQAHPINKRHITGKHDASNPEILKPFAPPQNNLF